MSVGRTDEEEKAELYLAAMPLSSPPQFMKHHLVILQDASEIATIWERHHEMNTTGMGLTRVSPGARFNLRSALLH